MTLAAEGTIFNIINSNTVLAESETLVTKVAPYMPGGIGGQLIQLANPRVLRLRRFRGSSSLEHLKKTRLLPADCVKRDFASVRNLPAPPNR